MNKYIECWDANIISSSVLDEAIDTWLQEHPRTYDEELQGKLAYVRNQIEYENTWKEPTFEELKDGDVVQIYTSFGWFEGTWPGILMWDTHVRLWGGETTESRFNHADLRVRK